MWRNFLLMNLNEFDKLGISDFPKDVILEDLGERSFRITKGVNYGVVFVDEDFYLSAKLNGNNPFVVGDRRVYIDDKRNLYVGYYSADTLQ